jgi:lysophospholipase L1-like esterase
MFKDIRVCFVGDSFVNGTGDETALGWTGRVIAAAHAAGNPVTGYNLGIRRDTSRDVQRRWQSECSCRLPDGCDGRIVFSFGVNDTVLENGAPRVPPEESRAHAREILLGATRYKVLMLGPPPVDDTVQNERIMRLSHLLAREAWAIGVPYIDLFSPLVRDTGYIGEISANDGSHPGSNGYAQIAELVLGSPAWWFQG